MLTCRPVSRKILEAGSRCKKFAGTREMRHQSARGGDRFRELKKFAGTREDATLRQSGLVSLPRLLVEVAHAMAPMVL